MMRYLVVLILVASVNVDIYQDRSDSKKSVVVVEVDGVVSTYSVKNSELESLVDKVAPLEN